MPTNALDILSLDAAKLALRVDAAADDDADLTASINAAVDFCQRVAGKPFLDQQRTFYLARPVRTLDPLVVPVGDLLPGTESEPPAHRAVEEIAYWTVANGALNMPPDGEVAVANLGRIEEVKRGCTSIWPNADGWPEVLADSQFKVTVTQGYADADSIPGIAGIRKAVALMTTVYFEGAVDEEYREAVLALLTPYSDAALLM